jgi:hypothetical protein
VWSESLGDYGDSIVKLGPPVNNKFPVVDYFIPDAALPRRN